MIQNLLETHVDLKPLLVNIELHAGLSFASTGPHRHIDWIIGRCMSCESTTHVILPFELKRERSNQQDQAVNRDEAGRPTVNVQPMRLYSLALATIFRSSKAMTPVSRAVNLGSNPCRGATTSFFQTPGALFVDKSR